MHFLGDIKRITNAVDRLRVFNSAAIYNDFTDGSVVLGKATDRKCKRQRVFSFSDDDDDESIFTTDNPEGIDPRRVNPLEEEIKNAMVSEYFRTAISVLYAFSVFLLASFMLAVVHDRLPDTTDYPPLPDVILENLPVMPWAFVCCEICASILMFFWMLILIFHKYRLVVLRRSCAIAGSIFLLRCFTMYVTSLSVPGKHLQCSPTVITMFYYILLLSLLFSPCKNKVLISPACLVAKILTEHWKRMFAIFELVEKEVYTQNKNKFI